MSKLVSLVVFGLLITSCTNSDGNAPAGANAEEIEFAPLDENLSPAQITLAFIQDFKTWNDYSHSLSTAARANAVAAAQKSYDRLIEKYCHESYSHQPIAFGSESRHDPENETILSFDVDGDRATVHTKHERIYGDLDLSDFFEYSFEMSGDRWYLVSVAVVIDGEKFEGL